MQCANVEGAPPTIYCDQRYTLEEYKQALEEEIEFPDKDDSEDPRYYKKYAHTLPPLDSYFIIPLGQEKVSTAENTNNRDFFDWNNFTEFEKEKVELLRAHMRDINVEVPTYLTDSEILKYA